MKPVTISIRPDNIRTILQALSLYDTELGSVDSNDKIQSERQDLKIARHLLRQHLAQGSSLATVTMDEDLWGLVKVVCLAYATAKRSKLHLMKKTENVIGSTESEERKIAELDNLLATPFMLSVTARTLLVKDFIRLLPSNGEPADKLSIQIQAGDIYGQLVVAGKNIGTTSQTNTYTQIYEELNALTADVLNDEYDLDTNVRTNAAGDIQSIQAQLTKPNPDGKVISSALRNLSILADVLQVGQVALLLAPRVEMLTHIITKSLGH